jgi:hypothetical protein
MELLGIKLEGKREDIQWIQVLVPLRHLSLNPNVCGLRRRFSVGYSDVMLPLEERTLLDTRDINSPKD